ncbi:MAG: beta-xylosidase, partial [Prevotella sp.]|nr:beta-xylosidase [Prevotella sp.]
VDPEPTACEAPNVWKRIGEEKWVLMYDCYGQKTHNFGFVETTDFKTFTPLGQFNAKKKGQKEATMKTENFTSPKHGAVVQLSEAEARRLCDYWGEAY